MNMKHRPNSGFIVVKEANISNYRSLFAFEQTKYTFIALKLQVHFTFFSPLLTMFGFGEKGFSITAADMDIQT